MENVPADWADKVTLPPRFSAETTERSLLKKWQYLIPVIWWIFTKSNTDWGYQKVLSMAQWSFRQWQLRQHTVKLDTRAEVSILPLHLYNKLQSKLPLKTTTMKLSAYGISSIKPTGTCRLNCNSDSNLCDVKFYVAPAKAQAILGVNDHVQLGLVKWVCAF